MPSHRPISLSTHPSPPFRPNSPLPPFSTSPTFPTSASSSPERPQGQPFPEFDTGHPSSHLRTRVSSIRCAIARKQLLFGMNAKVNRDAVERRVEDLQRHDEEDGMRARLAAQRMPTPLQEQEEPESPSDEAMRFSKVDGNGMDDQGRET